MRTVARRLITEVGYVDEEFNATTCSIMTNLSELPASETSRLDEQGMAEAVIEWTPALNQATVFGYACRHTPASCRCRSGSRTASPAA